MASRPAASLLRHAPRAIPPGLLRRQPTHANRNFFSLPSNTPQVLTARRQLPYSPSRLYDLIADIDSYPKFLPYCQTSQVTRWTPPDADGRRWPTQADLAAGWGGFEETYTSRVFCIPGSIVEAISGDAHTEIPEQDLRRFGLRDPGPESGAREGPFTSLVTRWTVQPLEKLEGDKSREGEWSEVDLSIKFQFANPLFAAVSSTVADKIAPIMVEAFVNEARRVLGTPRRS